MGFYYFSPIKQYVIPLLSGKYVLQRNDFSVKSWREAMLHLNRYHGTGGFPLLRLNNKGFTLIELMIVVAIIALQFVVGLVKWLISMVLMLAAGYVVWRIFKAVVL